MLPERHSTCFYMEERERIMNRIFAKYFTVMLLVLQAMPGSAWALQPHSAPEGLYVHQMSHLLFTGALVYLYMHTRRTPELQSKGWKYLQTFCILFSGWNLLALIGHEAIKFLTPEDFIHAATWNEQIGGPITPVKMVYFITKMDHLIYVPALLFLVIALRVLSREALKGKEK